MSRPRRWPCAVESPLLDRPEDCLGGQVMAQPSGPWVSPRLMSRFRLMAATRWPSRSGRRSNANASTAARSPPGPKPAERSSAGSTGTTRPGCTPASTGSHPSSGNSTTFRPVLESKDVTSLITSSPRSVTVAAGAPTKPRTKPSWCIVSMSTRPPGLSTLANSSSTLLLSSSSKYRRR